MKRKKNCFPDQLLCLYTLNFVSNIVFMIIGWWIIHYKSTNYKSIKDRVHFYCTINTLIFVLHTRFYVYIVTNNLYIQFFSWYPFLESSSYITYWTIEASSVCFFILRNLNAICIEHHRLEALSLYAFINNKTTLCEVFKFQKNL